MIGDIKHKLRKFIIRYHTNQMIKGTIIAFAGLIAVWLMMVLAEYIGYFNTNVRFILILAYIIFSSFILYKNIIISILKIYGVKKPMSDEEAARYIGNYLPEVKDKLTNLLQLATEKENEEEKRSYLNQAIDQKSNELKPFDFKSVIDFRVNKKYLKYLFPPLIIVLAILISAPDVITEPTKRLTKYNTDFERPQPFYVNLLNDNLEVVEGENFQIEVKVNGNSIPDKLYYKAGNERYKLKKLNDKNFTYTLKNVRKSKDFIITDGIVKSRTYNLIVRNKPEILGYSIKLDYPKYTGKEDQENINNGDLIVPRGTKIYWEFNTKNTKRINLYFNDEKEIRAMTEDFRATKTALDNFNYGITGENKFVKSKDTLRFTVNVTPDQYPEIELNLVDDSTSNERIFFNGIIADDYGFSKLTFHWKKGNSKDYKKQVLNVEYDISRQIFFHALKFDTILNPGEELKFYFEVWDNDQIAGPKSAKTEIMTKKEPTREEIEKEIDQSSERFKKEAKETSSEIKKMNEQFENLRKKLIEKENLDWDDKESIRKFLKQTEQLKEKINKLKKELEEKIKNEEKLKKKNEDILRKEEQLKELMEKLLDEELLKKIEELRKMLEKQNKDNIRNNLEEMNQQNIDLEKELERSLELFKRLEVEKGLQDAIDELNKLEKKQEELNKKEGRGKEKSEKQKDINRKFDNIKKDLEDTRNKNAELEEPMNMEDTKKDEDELKEKLQEALDQLKQGKSKKGSKSQKQAKQKMQQLSDKLQNMMQAMQQQSRGEDMREIRELLENTIKLSVNQEDLMEDFKHVSKDDPNFVDLIEQQKELKEDLQKVKDSLYAISKRQFMIQSFVNKELSDIDRNMSKTLEAMLALNTIGYTRMRDKSEATKRQQYVMKSLNNIALMLAESMEQMKQQMRKKGNKQGNCKNPKPGKSGKPSLQQMQKQLNNSLKQMQQQMKQGKNPGKDGRSMSEKLARAAAKQREIRKKLEELRKEMQSKGNPSEKSIGETLKEMEKTEEDLVNKILNEQMLKRQEEILTRLLEHENAKREQEFEKKRKSEEAKNIEKSNPDQYLEYKRIKEKETELLRMVPPELTPFYRKKINEYYLNLGR